MHEAGSANDLAAVRFCDALMSKTNTKDRSLLSKAQNYFFTDAGLAWSTWSGRYTNMTWR